MHDDKKNFVIKLYEIKKVFINSRKKKMQEKYFYLFESKSPDLLNYM